jgi:hypothetical protein
MPDILKSIHGRDLGLSAEGADNNAFKQRPALISRGGFIAGGNGNQIVLPSPAMISHFDDFTGDVIADQWNLLEGTDNTTTDAAILAGGIGGVLRLTSGDAGTGLAADLVQISSLLQWQASNGGLRFQIRLKVSLLANTYIFAGFTDTAALEAPIISAASGDTFTTTASDAVGFMYDTRMATDNWWLTGVAADVDATMQNSGFAPVADTYETLAVEVSAAGRATFFRNGKQVGTQMSGAVTPATDLTPTFMVAKSSVTTSALLDVDYVNVSMARAADGGAV